MPSLRAFRSQKISTLNKKHGQRFVVDRAWSALRDNIPIHQSSYRVLVNCDSQKLRSRKSAHDSARNYFVLRRRLNRRLCLTVLLTKNQLGIDSSIKQPSACYLSSLFGFKLTSILRSFKEITAGVHRVDRSLSRDLEKLRDGLTYHRWNAR